MSIESRVVAALNTLNIPVEASVYHGNESTYFTYFYSTTVFCADDEPVAEKYLLSAHLFAPLTVNIRPTVNAAKRAIFNAGFTWPEVTDVSDDDGRHIVFEFEEAEGVSL